MLGSGAYWGYNQYQAFLKENQELKNSERKIPSSADENSLSVALTPTKVVNGNGVIKGNLAYPSEVIPSLEIYAFNTKDKSKFYMIKTDMDQKSFSIGEVTPGEYFVVAYYNNLAGGYTKAVSCGLSVDCIDHSLIPVTVRSGEMTTGIEVRDWYAPEGSFPEKPQ